ncbi:hypothetical protein [Parabacteroides sp. PF5-6]|uniref:hypothetical protein n=1 Tax=Parabacteroides sp. PF5-6 TaxID=1742403 RepID=UPI0024057549|nr:hypothetical protein [Parabacteroides sp. PF5-6]MDF9830164.1 hypothetical protein [Parabacteroides sp. PF5-6]
MRKISILIFCLFLTSYSYSDVSRSPVEECCSDIVFQLNEQNKILSEQTVAIQNRTFETNEINTYLSKLSDLMLSQKEDISSIPKNKILGIPENLAIILFPALITLMIFFLGEILKWYRKQEMKRNETKEYREVILNWIDLINNPIQKQIEACDKIAVDILNSQNIHPERMEYRKMLADKIDSIGVDRFINTFMINSTAPKSDAKNDKMTYNLVSQFNFLKSIEPNLSETYKEYQVQTLALMDEWNSEFMKLNDLTSSWAVKAKNKSHPYFVFNSNVAKIVNGYILKSQQGENNTVNTINNLISPLTALTNDELANNLENEYAFEMSSILQQFRIIDKKWNINVKGYSYLFSGMAKSINNSYSTLLDAKKYFKNETEVKGVLSI